MKAVDSVTGEGSAMTARSLVLMTLSLLALVATDASADTCSVAKKLSCIRHCPTVATCTAKAASVCPEGTCSAKEIGKGCKKEVAKCRVTCRTPCLRSCKAQIDDCVRATDPGCFAPDDDELYPLRCDRLRKSCLAESAALCRKQACCTIPTRFEITETSCPEEPCSCGTPVAGRRWTYGAAGTSSGPVGTRFLVNGYITDLQCGGWTSDPIPFQGPSCLRATADQPVQIAWTGTGPGIGPGLLGDGTGCYCSLNPWPTVISGMATDGVEAQATSDKDVICP